MSWSSNHMNSKLLATPSTGCMIGRCYTSEEIKCFCIMTISDASGKMDVLRLIYNDAPMNLISNFSYHVHCSQFVSYISDVVMETSPLQLPYRALLNQRSFRLLTLHLPNITCLFMLSIFHLNFTIDGADQLKNNRHGLIG